MFINNLSYYAFFSVLILFSLSSIAYGDEFGSHNCDWGDWGIWSDCVNGYQTRTKVCNCQPNTGSVTSSGYPTGSSSGANSNTGSMGYGSGTNSNSNTGSMEYGSKRSNYDDISNGQGDDSINVKCNGTQPTETRPCESGNNETVPCNTQNCSCSWDYTNSKWEPCQGSVRRRYPICNCGNNSISTTSESNSDSYNSGSNQNTGSYNSGSSQNSGSSGMNNCDDEPHSPESIQCPGPLPYEEEPCIEISCPPVGETPTCVWEGWSEWTQCEKFCNGIQFRRQLCSCSANTNETCSDSYNDTLCIGIPLTETQSCNITIGDKDLCSNTWAFLEEWSSCVNENHYGDGTQWRRQFCLEGNGNLLQDEDCSYTGVTPLFETRNCSSCNLTNCCEWVFNESISWSNCSGVCGQGIQMRFPYTCSCGDVYQCPPPDFEFEIQNCDMNTDCSCKFDIPTEPTLCDGSTGSAWYSQKCICADSLNSTSCDISNCYGAPLTIIQPCGCNLHPALSVENWRIADWPVANDTQFRTFTCSNLTWFQLINQSSSLNTTNGNDNTTDEAWNSLAVEYIAAQLNILSGVQASNQTTNFLQNAEDLLDNCTWSINQTQESQQLLNQLHTFNSNSNRLISHLEQDAQSNNDDEDVPWDGHRYLIICLIVIPAVLLVVFAIIGVIIFIRKRQQKKKT